MRISRGRQGKPERFDKLNRYTGKKKSGKKSDNDSPIDKIFVPDPKKTVPSKESPQKNQLSFPRVPDREKESNPEGSSPTPKKPSPTHTSTTSVKHHPIRSAVRYSFIGLFLLLTIITGVGIQVFRNYIRDLPTPQALERFRPMLISRMYSSEHQLIGEYIRERRKLVSIKEVPENLKNAIIAREDKNFRTHLGIDPEGFARAVVANLKAGRLKEGGSTLTQQLVKNLTNQREKAFKRKIREGMLALKVERNYSKEEILELYLNQVYFGHGCNGIGSAAEYYFSKEVSDLNLNECAMLAGLIQRPQYHSPFVNPKQARIRRISVLRRMYDEGCITEKQFIETSSEELHLANSFGRQTQKNLAPYFYEYVRLSLDYSALPQERVSILPPYPLESPQINQVGFERLYTDGLSIETTLNYPLQEAAREALRKGVRQVEQVRRKYPSYWGEPEERKTINTILVEGNRYDAKIIERPSKDTLIVTLPDVPEAAGNHTLRINLNKTWLDEFGVLGPGYWLQVEAQRTEAGQWEFVPASESHVQACLVALEADTGKILALIGGYNFFENQEGAKIIHPFQAPLQPGSCFKPILFACALSRGMTPSDTIDELPLEYMIGDRTWSIENFESLPWNPSLHGTTPLRRALIMSMNVASVHLWNHLTQDNKLSTVSRFARENMGLLSPVRPERASALGVSEMYPIELAAAYAAFANGGRRIYPYAIEKITDHYDNILAIQYPSNEPILRDPKLSAQIAYQITHDLQDVFNDPEGTAYRTIHELYPNGFPYPVAGKTGTTNECTDAWFCGYNPRIVTCVWVGFERKKSLGEKMTGSRVALPIWAEFMEKAIPTYHASVKFDPEEESFATDFPVPPGMVFVEVCKKSGLLANKYCREAGRSVREAFIAGTQPKNKCTYHGPAEMDAFDDFVQQVIASGDDPIGSPP